MAIDAGGCDTCFLPKEIDALENEQAQINEKFTNPNIYRDKPELVQTLQKRLAEIEAEVEGNRAFAFPRH